jgi:hypothetical protein
VNSEDLRMLTLTALLLALNTGASLPCSRNPAAVREIVQQLHERASAERTRLRLTLRQVSALSAQPCGSNTKRKLAAQKDMLSREILDSGESTAAERVLTRALFNQL